ncbi:prepilin peptidase [Amnibacterium sp. CER49]|uniref:prepilin peptidase n=1 Tax=Amnibacterium sp. CER49 TaxID=3039161 RepID=UPI00244C54D9|nr:prepilin peptidase [Amnibacterium sp. CER49]MDH2444379.1 prepilin peptidase [Amnibacterium sp. CER49]
MLALLSAACGGAAGPWLVGVAHRNLRTPLPLGIAWRVAAAAATALLFAVLTLRLGPAPVLPAYLVLAAAAVVLSIVDLAERRLPDRIVLPTAVAVGGALVLDGFLDGRPGVAVGVLLGAAGMFTLFLALAVASHGQVGMGDVKLALVVGAAAGALGLSTWLLALVFAVLLNGVVALVALLTKRVGLHGAIPFGPSMLAGALLAVALA